MFHSFYETLVVWLGCLFLWATTSSAFQITAPSMVRVSETTMFNWTWESQDGPLITLGLLDADKGHCGPVPDELANAQSFNPNDLGKFNQRFEQQFSIRKLDLNQSVIISQDLKQGNFSWALQRTGNFQACAYKYNFNSFVDNTGRNKTGFGNMTLIANSSTFPAQLAVATVTSASNPTLVPGNSSGSPAPKKMSTGLVAGLALGAVIFLLILIAAFFIFRRIRYRRRLAAFHKERMFRQIPPTEVPSYHAADVTEKGAAEPSLYTVNSLIQPPPETFSTQSRSQHIPLGYDNNMRKSFYFPPPMHSAPSSGYSNTFPDGIQHSPSIRTLTPLRRDSVT